MSDNLFLSKKFLKIIENKQINVCSFTFSTSPFSNKDDFNILNTEIKVSELETQYLIAVRLSYTEKNDSLENLINDVKKLLLGFRNYIIKNSEK